MYTFNKDSARTLVEGQFGVGYYMGQKGSSIFVFDIDGGQLCTVSKIVKARSMEFDDIEDALMRVDGAFRDTIDNSSADEAYKGYAELLELVR